ncbi:hypothetical protein BGZ65_010543 [Modicella reniformis]|uniref:Uncharacterized protein n=1 Tax=Modicella reniformis TaxID=1440133 RepID=A0A9P6IID1_9FUNG|nr:hypothetical protein BGZ65_010543 [Modicella reniformis]
MSSPCSSSTAKKAKFTTDSSSTKEAKFTADNVFQDIRTFSGADASVDLYSGSDGRLTTDQQPRQNPMRVNSTVCLSKSTAVLHFDGEREHRATVMNKSIAALTENVDQITASGGKATSKLYKKLKAIRINLDRDNGRAEAL